MEMISEKNKKEMARSRSPRGSVLHKLEGGAHNGGGSMEVGIVEMLPRARGGNQSELQACAGC